MSEVTLYTQCPSRNAGGNCKLGGGGGGHECYMTMEGTPRSRVSCFVLRFYMKKESNEQISSNEVDYTHYLILLVKNMLCSKLHRQKGFNPIRFSHKIWDGMGTHMRMDVMPRRSLVVHSAPSTP